MSQKGAVQEVCFQAADATFGGSCRTPHNTRPEIDEVGAIIDDNRQRWPRSLRVGARRPRTEQDNLRIALSLLDRQQLVAGCRF